jgi:hypothetical protein
LDLIAKISPVPEALGRVKRRDGGLREVPDPARLLQLNSLVQPEPVAAPDEELPRPPSSNEDRVQSSEAADLKVGINNNKKLK